MKLHIEKLSIVDILVCFWLGSFEAPPNTSEQRVLFLFEPNPQLQQLQKLLECHRRIPETTVDLLLICMGQEPNASMALSRMES